MNKQPYISVIVPVYNTAQYLNDCLSSIVSQSHPHLQIILINDGSPDRCGEICDEWAEKDPRIQVIHQENRGVSAARNAGLEAASGEIISFVDSDDIIPSHAYEELLKAMGDADLAMGKMLQITEDGELIPYSPKMPPHNYPCEDFLIELFRENSYCYLGYLCDKLLRKEIVQKYHIRFNPEIKLNEDRLFLLEYMLHCHKLAFSDRVVYYYRQRGNSAISPAWEKRTVADRDLTVIDAFQKMAQLSARHTQSLHELVSRKAFECSLDLLRRVSKKDRKKTKKIRQFMWESAILYMRSPNAGILDKLKILGHCVLGK